MVEAALSHSQFLQHFIYDGALNVAVQHAQLVHVVHGGAELPEPRGDELAHAQGKGKASDNQGENGKRGASPSKQQRPTTKGGVRALGKGRASDRAALPHLERSKQHGQRRRREL